MGTIIANIKVPQATDNYVNHVKLIFIVLLEIKSDWSTFLSKSFAKTGNFQSYCRQIALVTPYSQNLANPCQIYKMEHFGKLFNGF